MLNLIMIIKKHRYKFLNQLEIYICVKYSQIKNILIKTREIFTEHGIPHTVFGDISGQISLFSISV